MRTPQRSSSTRRSRSKSPRQSKKQLYKLYKSTLKTKKFDIWIENPKTGNIKKISFGAKGYEDYSIHKDKERRERYRTRHKNDKINDPTSSGFWAYWILWGESTNKDTNLKKILKKYF